MVKTIKAGLLHVHKVISCMLLVDGSYKYFHPEIICFSTCILYFTVIDILQIFFMIYNICPSHHGAYMSTNIL